MNILDLKGMIDIDRFRKINIAARTPQEVYSRTDLAPEYNLDFLKECVRRIPVINFADFETGRIYARLEEGKWVWHDPDGLARAKQNSDAKASLEAIGSDGNGTVGDIPHPARDLDPEHTHTLGSWGR